MRYLYEALVEKWQDPGFRKSCLIGAGALLLIILFCNRKRLRSLLPSVG